MYQYTRVLSLWVWPRNNTEKQQMWRYDRARIENSTSSNFNLRTSRNCKYNYSTFRVRWYWTSWIVEMELTGQASRAGNSWSNPLLDLLIRLVLSSITLGLLHTTYDLLSLQNVHLEFNVFLLILTIKGFSTSCYYVILRHLISSWICRSGWVFHWPIFMSAGE